MALAVRNRDNPVPALDPIPGILVARERSAATMAAASGKPELDMQRRLSNGHRAYVAWEGDEAVGFGWVATRTAEIGELAATLTLPEGERYLWNFVTASAHRGRGIYPRLLQGIMRAEREETERFWIMYAPENHSSAAGIRRAGFVKVADISFDAEQKPALRPLGPVVAKVIEPLFTLRMTSDELAPCWKCVRAGVAPEKACRSGSCKCDYQRPEVRCG